RSPSSKSLAAANDHVRRTLVATGLLALGVPTPRAHRVRVALAGLTLTAAVRVIDRVHHDAAPRRPTPPRATRARLAVAAQTVLFITNLADGGAAVDVHLAQLGRSQTKGRVRAFARRALCGSATAARKLSALAGLQRHVVNRRT